MYWVFIRDGVLPGFLVGGTGFFFLPSFHAAAKGSSHQVRHHQRKAGPFPGLVGRRTLFVFCFFFCVFSFVLPSFLLVCLFFFGVRLLPLRSFVLRTFDPGFLLGSTACSKRPLEERNLFRLF